MMQRLAIIATHPIQYQAPWFKQIADMPEIELHVFFLWNPQESQSIDPGFKQIVDWDVALTEGYNHSFVQNISKNPGTNSFTGLNNPQLAKAVNEFNPTVVLCLAYKYLSIFRLLFFNKLKNRPLLLFRGDSHELASRQGIKSIIKHICLKYIFKQFDGFLYVGHANRNYFIRHGASKNQLFFCPHALNPEIFEPQKQSKDSEIFKIYFFGKLENKKRPIDLLDCFMDLELNNSELHFVGSGPLQSYLISQSRNSDKVSFHGFVNQTTLPSHYERASIVVLPSFGPYETWGLVVQEAAMLGVPSIVSTHVGCAHDLVNANTGYVFEAGNIEELKKSILLAYNQRANLNKLGLNAREHVSEYNYKTATEGLVTAINSLK